MKLKELLTIMDYEEEVTIIGRNCPGVRCTVAQVPYGMIDTVVKHVYTCVNHPDVICITVEKED